MTLDLSDEQIDEAAFRRAFREVFGREAPRRLPVDLDAARAGEPAPEAPAPKRGRKARVGA
jgi:hypothetical protein